jgi:hypothetical protein
MNFLIKKFLIEIMMISGTKTIITNSMKISGNDELKITAD